MVIFDLVPLLQGQMKIAKLKSASYSLTIAIKFLACETNLLEIMGWESSDVIRLASGPSFEVK